ncbi:MAG: metallophosphatase [Oscillospiraceae bacterium]|nr:metallophosphatase [Oscillospiraceae bacterium]
MIYVTGDCHSEFEKLSSDRFPEGKHLTKDDYVIICGDFGGIWWNSMDYVQRKTEDYWIRWLDKKPFTTLFVDGNHENHTRLAAYPVEQWHGGRVHRIADSVLHLMRGEIFELCGKRIFAFGGASSHDISDGILDGSAPDWRRQAWLMELRGQVMYRVKGVSWWEEELPDEEELQNGLDNLAKYNNCVDYIISHCASDSVQAMISGDYASDRLTQYFEHLRNTVQYDAWYFGHYHDDCDITEKDILLYHEIRAINSGK